MARAQGRRRTKREQGGLERLALVVDDLRAFGEHEPVLRQAADLLAHLHGLDQLLRGPGLNQQQATLDLGLSRATLTRLVRTLRALHGPLVSSREPTATSHAWLQRYKRP